MLEDTAVMPAENRVAWIVDDVIKHLNRKQKSVILNTPKQELFLMHHGLDRKIRNHYGLWQNKDFCSRQCCGYPSAAKPGSARKTS